MKNPDRKSLSGMTASRIQALNDGVFAIAMTLLVLNIRIPSGLSSASALVDLLNHTSLLLFDYALSFILLAFLWTAQHRQYHWIKLTDDILLWINIIFLLFIALIPVSTSIYGMYRNFWPGALFINLNLLAVFLLLYLMWAYVTNKPELLDSTLTKEHIAFTRRPSMLAIPALSIAAICLSFLAPAWSTLPYVAVPFIMTRRQ